LGHRRYRNTQKSLKQAVWDNLEHILGTLCNFTQFLSFLPILVDLIGENFERVGGVQFFLAERMGPPPLILTYDPLCAEPAAFSLSIGRRMRWWLVHRCVVRKIRQRVLRSNNEMPVSFASTRLTIRSPRGNVTRIALRNWLHR
jgi:hypothetical protein